jgi:hypothetical protein
MIDRRKFIQWAGASGIAFSSAGWSLLSHADSKKSPSPTPTATVSSNSGIKGRVVVIGGGMAGATVAIANRTLDNADQAIKQAA